jgi:hypothetical protein
MLDQIKSEIETTSDGQTIAWSSFALGRHKPGTGYSFFNGTWGHHEGPVEEELLCLVRRYFDDRRPARGSSDINAVCEVPIPYPEPFVCSTINVAFASNITAEVCRRQPHEDPYVRLIADGPPVDCKFASVILYSAAELLKNGGTRSSDADWEIVCVIASDIENEPMNPLAMARNQLGMPGGTPREYTSQEWAEAVYYWSQRIQRRTSK